MKNGRPSQSQLTELYSAIGKSLWSIQYAEDALCTLIASRSVIQAEGVHSLSDTDDTFFGKLVAEQDRLKSLPFGRVLRFGETLSRGLPEGLNQFKLQRNWLVHRSQDEFGLDIYDPRATAAFIKKVNSVGQEALLYQEKLGKIFFDEASDFGVNVEEAEARTRQKFAEATGQIYTKKNSECNPGTMRKRQKSKGFGKR
jgi:hypothetical protein